LLKDALGQEGWELRRMLGVDDWLALGAEMET
jgi:hypothetical protein